MNREFKNLAKNIIIIVPLKKNKNLERTGICYNISNISLIYHTSSCTINRKL